MRDKNKTTHIVNVGIPKEALIATLSACGIRLVSKVCLELTTVQNIVNNNGSITKGLTVDGINVHIDEKGLFSIVGENGIVELNPNINRTYVINGTNYEVLEKNICVGGVKIEDNSTKHEGITIILSDTKDDNTFVNGIQIDTKKQDGKNIFIIGQHNFLTMGEYLNLVTRNRANALSASEDGKLMIGTKAIEYIENDDKFIVCIDQATRNGVTKQLNFVIRPVGNKPAQMYINGKHVAVTRIVGAQPFERALFIDGVETKVGGIK